ncbi:hypothetical protein Patl1_14929 [Pistacia atlantica]|uniref:Uncharacterized protein n=1 Tax=Pistacia atlantica TaxID=434234 RepID=A0ACC1B5J1_9ROSI|nr:hypothetical protein Patl1_14929 [Pistacia atlantica]
MVKCKQNCIHSFGIDIYTKVSSTHGKNLKNHYCTRILK